MREFSLEEIVELGRRAENIGSDDARLCYLPGKQCGGANPIVEAQWPDEWRDENPRLVEVFMNGHEWGCAPAPVEGNGFTKGSAARLPHIPSWAWIHEEGCDCAACDEERSSARP